MNKKKLRFSKIVIASVLLGTVAFTVCMIWLFARYQSTPDQLIICFFSFCGAEAGILGWLKRTDS